MVDKQRQLIHSSLIQNMGKEEIKHFTELLNSKNSLLDILVETLKREVEKIQVERLSNVKYTTGAWPFKQAELNGQENFANRIIKLLELKGD